MSSLCSALRSLFLMSITLMISCSKLVSSPMLILRGIVSGQTPKCAHHNNHHEGLMNFIHRDEEVNYFPSRLDPVRHAERYPIPPPVLNGIRDRVIIEKENNLKRPREQYRSWDADRQERFVCRWVDTLSNPRVTLEMRSIWISYWSQVNRHTRGMARPPSCGRLLVTVTLDV